MRELARAEIFDYIAGDIHWSIL